MKSEKCTDGQYFKRFTDGASITIYLIKPGRVHTRVLGADIAETENVHLYIVPPMLSEQPPSKIILTPGQNSQSNPSVQKYS